MRKNLYYLLALSILLSTITMSCTNNSKASIPVIDIEAAVAQGHSLNLSDYCSNIEYIPLQTDSTALIGSYPMLEVGDNSIFITSRTPGVNVKMFDKKGNFLRNIGNKGNGKGEFVQFISFLEDNNGASILINDNKKITIYNSSNGLYTGEIPLDSLKKGAFMPDIKKCFNNYFIGTINNIQTESAEILFFDNSGKALYRENLKSKTSTYEMNINDKITVVRSFDPSIIFTFNNEVRFIAPSSDTIFSYSKDFSKASAYIFNYGKYKINPEGSNFNDAIKLISSSFLESDKCMFFKYTAPQNNFPFNNPKGRIANMIYDKQQEKTFALNFNPDSNLFGLQNDIDNGAPFWPQLIKDNKMYQVIDAATFISISEKNNSEKMKQIAATLTENSNPVVVVAMVK